MGSNLVRAEHRAQALSAGAEGKETSHELFYDI